MRNVNGKEYKDLKELAWDVYGHESYEAEMALRYVMEAVEHCFKPKPKGDERAEGKNLEEAL